ncbi:MAG TPA: hypothetical protein VNO75_10245 [Gemmatimonadaceae bacterium]|nr:hypothetical protein [Gemmatimonadaceae bacterium]
MKPLVNTLRLLVLGSGGLLMAACAEKLDSSGVCSILCPPVGGEVQNITIEAVAFDTTVQSLSGPGAEEGLLLATRGDTLDARVIVRFDSLPTNYLEGVTETPISFVDSASVRLILDTLSVKGSDPVTIEAYDVDTTASDTSTADVLALFRSDRLITSQTFTRAELRDTLRYVLPGSHVLAKVQGGQRLRIGFRSVSSASTQMVFSSTQVGEPPVLRFRVSADTAIQPFTITPLSKTPTDDAVVAANLGDYTVFAQRPSPGSASDLVVGGFPPRRSYLRFDIPANILDSSTVIRATILLNQLPNPLLDPTDSVMIVPLVVLAGVSITDPTKAAQITTDFGADSLKARPGESGLRLVEIGTVFGAWRQLEASETPHAIVFQMGREGRSPLEIRFSSLEAAPALRPRLRISFTNEVPLGLP